MVLVQFSMALTSFFSFFNRFSSSPSSSGIPGLFLRLLLFYTCFSLQLFFYFWVLDETHPSILGKWEVMGFVKQFRRKRTHQQMHLWMDVQECFCLSVFQKEPRIKMLTVKEHSAPNLFIYFIWHNCSLTSSVLMLFLLFAGKLQIFFTCTLSLKALIYFFLMDM